MPLEWSGGEGNGKRTNRLGLGKGVETKRSIRHKKGVCVCGNRRAIWFPIRRADGDSREAEGIFAAKICETKCGFSFEEGLSESYLRCSVNYIFLSYTR